MKTIVLMMPLLLPLLYTLYTLSVPAVKKSVNCKEPCEDENENVDDDDVNVADDFIVQAE